MALVVSDQRDADTQGLHSKEIDMESAADWPGGIGSREDEIFPDSLLRV